MNIALVSPNLDKYSETFIHAQMNGIKHLKCIYFGGHLPNKLFLVHERVYVDIHNEDAFRESLVEQKISSLLAQYGPTGVACLSACKSLGIPMTVHFHGYDASRKDVIAHYAESYLTLFKEAKNVISVSDMMSQDLIRLGCPHGKIVRLNYGVDMGQFVPGKSKKNGRIELLTVGRLVEKKGHHITLEAFRLLVNEIDAHITIVGDGPRESELKLFVRSNDLENNVSFVGAQPQSEVIRLMLECDFYVQHSITAENGDKEGTPLAIIEALACGKPVLSTRHAGIQEVVLEGVNGCLVNEKDGESFFNNMLELAQNQNKRNELSKNCRSSVIDRYSLNNYLESLNSLVIE